MICLVFFGIQGTWEITLSTVWGMLVVLNLFPMSKIAVLHEGKNGTLTMCGNPATKFWTKCVKIVQRKPSTYGLIKSSLMAIQLYHYYY